MAATIKIDKTYAASTGSVTLTLSGSPDLSNLTYYEYRANVDGTGEVVVAAGQKMTSATINISKTGATGTSSCVEFKCVFKTAATVSWDEKTLNTVNLYIIHTLSMPKIVSITPPSPQLSETIRISWLSVDNADYYSVMCAYRDNDKKIIYRSKQVHGNIVKDTGSDVVYVDTCPQNYSDMPLIEQSGYLWYNIVAYSNSPAYTRSSNPTSENEYTIVNLNLASNLRFKLGGEWIRGKPYIKVGGKWHRAVKTYVKINGKWVNA